MSMREKYNELPPVNRSCIKRKFMFLFGAVEQTFYNKIDGKSRLRPVELNFFKTELSV